MYQHEQTRARERPGQLVPLTHGANHGETLLAEGLWYLFWREQAETGFARRRKNFLLGKVGHEPNTEQASFALSAVAAADKTQQITDALLSAGAHIVEHQMKIPTYQSWATITPGAAIEYIRDHYTLRYIPSTTVSYEGDPRIKVGPGRGVNHRAGYELRIVMTEALVESLRRALSNRLCHGNSLYYSPTVKNISERGFYTWDYPSWLTRDGFAEATFDVSIDRMGRYAKNVHTTGSIPDILKTFENAYGIKNYESRVSRPLVYAAKQSIRNGRPEHFTLDSRLTNRLGNIEVTIQPTQLQDLLDDGGHLYHQSFAPSPIQGFAMRQSPYLEATMAAIKELQQRIGQTIAFELGHQHEVLTTGNFSQKDVRQRQALMMLFDHYFQVQQPTIGDRVHTVAQTCAETLLDSHAHIQVTQSTATTIEAIAPLSERGKLMVSLDRDADVGSVMNELAELGFVAHADVINHHYGPVNPRHPDYRVNGYQQLQLKPGYAIMHGLTGVKSIEQAASRFGDIIASGGLLSYSERRRQGLDRHSMSPLGDMASGVDWGVPCTIGPQPSYGKWLVFILKPSVLYREHVFFSDRDYGGGKDRHDHYQEYAQKIGQRSFLEPPNHHSRQQHLNELPNIIARGQLNEVWFRWSVTWDEIAAVVVNRDGGLLENISAQVSAAQAAGRIPHSIDVLGFEAARDDVEKERFEVSTSLLENINSVTNKLTTSPRSSLDTFDGELLARKRR